MIEYLFICLRASPIFFSEKCVLTFIAHFSLGFWPFPANSFLGAQSNLKKKKPSPFVLSFLIFPFSFGLLRLFFF